MKYLQQEVIEEKAFKVPGTWQSMWAAQAWLKDNGYNYGSSCAVHKEIAITKGEYDLPQKWKNFNKLEKSLVDGVMVSNDYREGEVKIYLFKPKV